MMLNLWGLLNIRVQAAVETSPTGSRWKQQVLASRPDAALSSTGLGRRAFNPPEPAAVEPCPWPVLVDVKDFEAWSTAPAHKYVRVLVRRRLLLQVGDRLKGRFTRFVGGWAMVEFTECAMTHAEFVSVVDALRRWRCDTLGDSDRTMCAHFVARACFAEEADACASAPPVGGSTAAYRDWRDMQCANVAENALNKMVEMLGNSQNPPGQLAAQARLAAMKSVRALACDAKTLVNRWMTESEARCFVREAARATAVIACLDATVSVGTQQECLDVLAVLLRQGLAAPVTLLASEPWLSNFAMLHDALCAALHNDKLDTHESAVTITTDAGTPLAAVCTTTERVRPRHATRAVKITVGKLFDALCADAVDARSVLFESHPALVVAADFVKRDFGESIAKPAKKVAPLPPPARAVPNYVRRFPNLSPVDAGVATASSAMLRVTLTTGDGSGAQDMTTRCFEVRHGKLTAGLPAGVTVMAAYFDVEPGTSFCNVRRLRAAMAWDSGQTTTLACDELSGSCRDDDEVLILMSRGLASAKILVFNGKIASMYFFLGASI